jgi:RNA polymerase sigma factor (sigma-70 family)
VAHNKCVDHVRKKKEILLTVPSFGEDDRPDLVAQMPGPEFLPDQLDDHKALAMLRDVLGAMGPPCRQLLYVRFFEELSYEATAAKVAIPVAQVGVYIERCVRRLRDQIERQPKVWEELKALL